MVRIILGVIVGFIVWSVLWVGSDALIAALSPGWYGKSLTDFQTAVDNKTPYTVDTTILIISLIRSVIFSIISGFAAAWIARENSKTTLALGVLLLLFGIFIQSVYWSYIPLWYHLIFLILLIPMVIWGGKLKKF
jgi:hypothetical protein